MSPASLNDAYLAFAAAATELRREFRNSFASRLEGAFAKDPMAAWAEVPQTIGLVRRQFSDDFINVSAAAVIDQLNPGGKQDIIRQLRSFQNQGEQPRSFDRLLHHDERWRPGPLRVMLGAAIGAAAALLLLALQTTGPQYGGSAAKQTPITHQAVPPAGPGAAAPSGAPPGKSAGAGAPAAAPAPTEVQPAPAAEPVGADAIEQAALRILIAALGAALGAFVVVCPPLRSLVGGFGSGRGIVGLIGKYAFKFGLVFMMRRILLAAGLCAAILAAIGLLGMVFIGAKPIWSALFVLAAILGLLLARYSIPSDTASRQLAMRDAAINALNDQLGVDANTWCALSAALTVRTAAVAAPNPTLDQIRSIIGARRDRNDSTDSILRVIEQELNLDPGGAPAAQMKSEFTWGPEAAEQYDTVGIVEVGDLVTVMVAPQLGKDSRGVGVVYQKGKVRRKR